MDAPEALLTVQAVADLFGLNEATIRRWIRLRQIEYVKLGKAVRIKRSVVEAKIAAGTVRVAGKRAA